MMPANDAPVVISLWPVRVGRQMRCNAYPLPVIQSGLLWNVSRRWPVSFRLDVGRADHLAPFLSFVGDQLAKVGWRAGDHPAAEVGKPHLQLRISQPGVDLIVELGDDLCRCV